MSHSLDLSSLIAVRLLHDLPVMDCPACLYSQPSWIDSGHCYMFRQKPDGVLCSKFTRLPESTKQPIRSNHVN